MSTGHSASSIQLTGPAPSNVEVVAAAIREAIVDGRLGPGERIKEVPMARQIGISRGPIREALRLLEHDNLIKILPNRGAIVPEVGSRDVLEVYALRASLGSLALHKVTLAAGEEGLAPLEGQLAHLRRAVAAGKGRRAADADLGYQSAMVALADLPRVTREFERLTWQVKIFIATLDIRYESQLDQMLEEVDALHQAIESDDGRLAEQLWRGKLERWVRDFVLKIADDDFDEKLWVALTSGPAAKRPGRRSGTNERG